MKEILIEALKKAGRIQISYFDEIIGITTKESQSSIVTKVDLESEKCIINVLQSNFPDHNILSEECGFTDKKSSFTWIIDPLDGTSNYAAKIPWFGVLIALLDNGRPMLGGAYLPIQNKLYLAEKGKGATLNGSPINVTHADLKDTLFAFSTDYTEDIELLDKGMELFRFIVMNSRNVRCTNSLLDFLYVAEGKLGGDINLFTKIWDIAAPYLIITEAGGIMKDLTGNDLIFRADEEVLAQNYSIIATSENRFNAFKKLLIE